VRRQQDAEALLLRPRDAVQVRRQRVVVSVPAEDETASRPPVRQDEPRKETARLSAGPEMKALPRQSEEVAEAVCSCDCRWAERLEAARKASEAQALTQRISRRWIEESHDRRNRDAIEFRCAEQDAR